MSRRRTSATRGSIESGRSLLGRRRCCWRRPVAMTATPRLVVVMTALGVAAGGGRAGGQAGWPRRAVDRTATAATDRTPISFPTTLSAQLPKYADRRRDHRRRGQGRGGPDGRLRARRPITVRPGQTLTVYVRLDCGGSACVVDGGVGRHRRRHADARARVAATGASIRARPATRPSPRARRAHARRRTATTTFRARRTCPSAATARRSANTATTRRSGSGWPATGAARRAPATAARTTTWTRIARRPAATASSIRTRPATPASPRGRPGACPTERAAPPPPANTPSWSPPAPARPCVSATRSSSRPARCWTVAAHRAPPTPSTATARPPAATA